MGTRCFSCSLLTASFPQNHINFTLSRRTAPSLPSAAGRAMGLGGAWVPLIPPRLPLGKLSGGLFPRPGTHPAGAGAAHLVGGAGERRALPPDDHFPPRCLCKNPMKLGLLQQGGELPAHPALPYLCSVKSCFLTTCLRF